MPEVTDPNLLAQLNATGDQALSTMTPERAAAAKAISDGRIPIPTGTALRSPVGQQMLNDALAYDPTIDVADAAARTKARAAFTSGKQAQNITSFNTALGHLGTLAQNAEALNNGSFPLVNGVENWAESQIGDPRANNFNVAKQAVVDELERAFKGSGGSLTELQQWESTLNSSKSPAQLRGAIQQAAGLLQSRIGAMQDSYNAAMGTTDKPLPMLNPHAQDALSHFQSPDYLQQGYGAVAGALGGNTPPGGSGSPPSSPGGSPSPGGPTAPSGSPGGAPLSPLSQNTPGAGPQTVATGENRQVFDPQASAAVDQMVRNGVPFDQAQAYAKQNGFDLDPNTYAATLAYAAKNPGYKGSYANIQRTVPTTLMQQVSASAPAAAAVGAADAATFGTANKVGAGISAVADRLGGDNRPVSDIYDQNLASANINRDALTQTHPAAALGGQVAGFMLGDQALGAGLKAAGGFAPALAALGSKIPAVALPAAQDAAYGAAYGAGSSDSLSDVPKNALYGAGLAALGGELGRGAANAVGAVLTPPVSDSVRRLTDAGVALTPGQILGASGSWIGKKVKGLEDAATSIPGLGDAITGARAYGIQDFNKAALNEALAPIGQTAADVGHAGIADAQSKVGAAFSDALSRMQAVPDQQLTSDLQTVAKQANKLGPDAQARFNNIMDNDVQPLLAGKQQLNGADLQSLKQGMDGQISNLRGQGSSPQDRDLADRLSDVRDAFMNLAARTIPDAASDFQQANKAYSLLARINDAASKTKDGVFTPNQFRTAVGRQGYGTSRSNLATGSAPFQQMATDASTVLPSSVPDSGTAGREMIGAAMRYAPGAALGAGAGYSQDGATGALAGAALGSAAFSRVGVRGMQALLAGNRGRRITTLGDIVRANANLGGAVGTPALLDELPK